ncbi:unnamed protein product [Rotaria sordida]|uniref:Uncharacterized protein n=1 Tax=Rotaria sordida TaxID=392033 RepID=A0A814GUG3_9BILA|nr:unnamed protein product [Rotaria sordida]CAF1279379.1 unnamed protein product [Rotaria sordida]
MEIYGSSSSIQAYDTNRLIISDIPRLLIINRPVEFTIDVSKAGKGQLEVSINNGQVPKQVKPLENSKFHFTFIPLLNESHMISIKFNGHQVSGFPRQCQVITSDNVKIRGPSLNPILVGTQTWFTIDILHNDLSDLHVTIFTPTNEQLNPSTLLTSDGLRVDWTPSEIGTYIIHLILYGYSIPGSPFSVKSYDPKKILIIPPINDSTIGEPVKFLLDASKAGEGYLEISVNYSGRNIPNQINPVGNSCYEIQFIPQKAVIHYCNILFNNEHVPGSPFSINVMEVQRVVAIGKGLGLVPINIPTSFTVLTPNGVIKELKCSIKGPDDHLIECRITKIDLNRYEVTYIPDCVGEFYIEIFFDNIQIDYSPFIARSFDVNKIKVLNFPSSAIVGSSTYFMIDATDAGAGSLEIAVSRDGKNIPNYVQNEGNTFFRIQFIPDQPCMHQVQMKFNGIDIQGSPFQCNVFSNDFIFENYEYAAINKRTVFLIKPKLYFNPNIHVNIITPMGNKIKGKIEKNFMNSYMMDFIPNEIGKHEIIFYDNEEKKIIMTIFICQVYDISKIRISDLPLAIIHQLYKFTIDTSEAGNGVLSVKIKQNGNKILHEQTRISTHIYQISFTPETTDECTLHISFNGENYLRTLIIPVRNDCEQVHVSSIPSGVVGRPITFTIDVADSNLIKILITESHSGQIISHTMTSISNNKKHYEISFIPNIACQHIVSISYDGKLLSKNYVDVCNINKIHISSIKNGFVGKPLIFSVDTYDAGEGHLEVIVNDGQRTLPVELKNNQTRKFDITFIPKITGLHSIIISFNGIPIEGSPFMININNPLIIDDNNSLDENDNNDIDFLIGGQIEGTKVGEIAWIICETSLTDIYEDFSVYVTDPDKTIIKHTRIQDLEGRWRIEFEPTKVGIYQIQTGSDKQPINLASVDILPLDYERYIYGERIVYSNALNFISIVSDNENIKVQLISSNNNEIPIEIERHSLEWKIYYSLTATGYYQLNIIDDDNNKQLFDIYCLTERIDIFRNGGIEDITRLIIDRNKIIGDDINVIVKDALAHTIPAAFYRDLSRDLVIEYIPVRTDIHEVFIRTQNNLLDICPIRIMAFSAQKSYDPVLRVQVKEILEHTFSGIIDQNNQLEISVTDPFERPISFQRSNNEHGELTISLSPIRVGTHWICISNDDNDSFAVLPIFAYDDDYISLSPMDGLSPHEKTISNENNNNNNDTHSTIDSFSPCRELTTISEASEFRSSRPSSISPLRTSSPIREDAIIISPIISNESLKSPTVSDRLSPEVQTLDITDLIDPCVRNISKFSFKDLDDKLNVIIHDSNGNSIGYKTEHLSNGRKCISYEPTIVGPVKIYILKQKELINDSPLIVNAFDPSAVHVINFPKNIQINTATCFHIDSTKAGKGTLKIIIKDPNNQSLPIIIQKQSNEQLIIQFTPIVLGKKFKNLNISTSNIPLGLHTISILFNQIPITETPSQILVENIKQKSTIKNIQSPELEERGRSIYSKHELFLLAQQQQEKSPSLSSQTIPSLLAKSNEILNRQKNFLLNKEYEKEQILKLEEKQQLKSQYKPLNEIEIQRLQLIKEKFERGQAIDIVFDPRPYPFKILLQNSYPLINSDVHFLIDQPHVAYVHITINGIQIPLVAIRRHDDTFLLKFRPILAGDYLIILKDYIGQLIPGCPYNFPVYNPNGTHIEPFNRLQSINDCYFICNIDNVGQGKFFVMIYDPLKPIRIPCQIQNLSKNRIRISFLPSKIGTYKIYIAYRNIPINGKCIYLLCK